MDKLDLASAVIVANAAVNGTDIGVIKNHQITNGIISFDDVDIFVSALGINRDNLADVFSYLQTNITTAGTVAFNTDSDIYVFQDGGANDNWCN